MPSAESPNTDEDTPGMTDANGRSGISTDPMMGTNPARPDVSSDHSAVPILTDANRKAPRRALFTDDVQSASDEESGGGPGRNSSIQKR